MKDEKGAMAIEEKGKKETKRLKEFLRCHVEKLITSFVEIAFLSEA